MPDMPTLEFKGKSFVYTHHLSVPFRELVIDPKKSLPASGAKPSLEDNLIIHGDNLHALKALLPIYAGKVDCIYIDQPYNTGNEGWCYNDNVRSPLMRDWLKKASPVDKEDLERHDKWLCMMWPRLKLLNELLAPKGVLLVSIDDCEHHRLRLILDEIFRADNFVTSIPWQSRESVQNDTDISVNHEHIVVYARKRRQNDRRLKESNADKWYKMDGFAVLPMPLSPEKFSNPDNDTRGPWKDDPFDAPGVRENLDYDIKNSNTGEIFRPPKGRHWRTEEDKYLALLKDKRVIFGKTGESGPKLKVFYEEKKAFGEVATTWFTGSAYGTATEGTKELMEIFGQGAFDYPKPTRLIRELLRLMVGKNAIILDSFAGSGTTAHAVLTLNKEDDGKRKFILAECEDYADKLTAERVRRVIKGYKFEGIQTQELMREQITLNSLKNADKLLEKADSYDLLDGKRFDRISKSVEDGALVVTGEKKVTEKVEGLGGSFTFCTLGEEMGLDKLLAGEKLPAFDALAKYVFYTATGRTLQDVPKQKADSDAYIGETDLYRVHLLYRPDKAWLRSNGAALTEKLVERMVAANKGKKLVLVFAAVKFMGQRELTRQGVEFCQLPYTIHRIMGD